MKRINWTYDKVSKEFSNLGGELLSKTYKNKRSILDFICPQCGKSKKTSFRTFLYSKMCKDCVKTKKMGKHKRLLYKDVKAFFEKNGCKLLSSQYKNIRGSLTFICSCGRIGDKSFYNFKSSPMCRKCILIAKSERQRFSYDYVKKYFEDHNCKLLSKSYRDSSESLKYICKCGRFSRISFCEFVRGARCRECYKDRNSGEGNHNWQKDRKSLQENRKFRYSIRNLLWRCLNRTDTKKICKTEEILGYTYLELKNHIQNHKNWERVKDKRWHIDHIFPIQAFIDFGIRDVKLINSLDNLQPLLAVNNLKKNNKYCKKDFIKWLKNKNYKILVSTVK